MALVLSWVLPATTVWSTAPRVAEAAVRADVPLPSPASFGLPLSTPEAGRPPLDAHTVVPPAIPAHAVDLAGEPVEGEESRALAAMGGGGGDHDDPGDHDHQGHHCHHQESENHHHHQGTCGCDSTFYGPEQFVRTSGSRTEYVRTINVPAWIASPFELSVTNGAADGSHRVSSAWIYVNGTQVAGPSDFNPNVPGFERSVTLTPTTSLRVVLASQPGSYLWINLCGRGHDQTPPHVAWTAPLTGTTISDSTPVLSLSYSDPVGTGEPGASGVDLATLVVTLDGVDRTSLFTKRPGDASAEIPVSLALGGGLHHLRATIEDNAGNSAQALSDFTVDVGLPTIQVTAPARGAYLPSLIVTVRVTYADDVALDLSTLQVLVDGVDRAASFTKGAAEASATLTLAGGAHDVIAQIRDRAGNAAVPASTSFNLDATPPVVTIGKPLPESRHGTPQVEAIVQYHDDQALDLATFHADVDGVAVGLSQGPEGAMGILGPLADGAHTLSASIEDRAGNAQSASSHFWVDTGVPDIQIVQPPPGFILATATPLVLVAYGDPQGVDLPTFKLTVGADDRTASCQVGPSQATCPIPAAARLPEGLNVVTAQIKDVTGNLGTASSQFTVDTIAPTGTMVAPPAFTGSAVPAITFSYQDSGTGVAVSSIAVTVDGQDQTAWFARAPGSSTGVPPSPLSDGLHHVALTLADAAGNTATIEGSFTVDTTAPAVSVATPTAGAFVHDSTPELRVAYADAGGSSVVPGSVHVFHRLGDDPETEITSLFLVGDGEATATIPDTTPLADGTHHLRVTAVDRAGNVGQAETLFVLDTVAPTVTVVAPARDAFVSTNTPLVTVHYEDDRSGIDTATLVAQIDGTDDTSRLTVGPYEATGTLRPEDALSEGRHTLTVTLADRAGNPAAPPPTPHTFVVDTVPPTAAVAVPADGSHLGEPQSLVRVTYSDTDAGAGNGIGSVEVLVDGVDRTVEFTVGATEAEAQLNPPLGEGTHTVVVNVLDWARNPATASSTFVIETTAPSVVITAPAEGAFLKTSPVTVTGTVADGSQLVVECHRGPNVMAAVLGAPTAGERPFTCTVALEEGANAILVTSRDGLGREASATRNVTLDTHPPVVVIEQPTSGSCTGQADVTVSGTVSDDSPVTVRVEGTATSCAPDGAGRCQFSATVPVGSGSQAVLHVTAEDAATNAGEASTVVCVDRQGPTVHITQPHADAYLKGPLLTVQGTVEDALTPSTVEVNGHPESAPSLALARSFTAQVPVADGDAVPLTATGTDSAGNTGHDTVVVHVDSQPPQIAFETPAPGTVTREASIVVSGTVTDASPVTLTYGGQGVPLSGGHFSLEVPLPGGNVFATVAVALTATDAAGNSSSASLDVVVDRKAPQLTVAGPQSGDVLSSLPVVVQGTVQDDSAVSVTVNGQAALLTGQAWQATFPALPEGPYSFAVVATDAAGNVTAAPSVDVVVDLAAPVVTITAPPTGTLTRESAVVVEGHVEETSAVQVTVNGVTAAVQRTGPTSWSFTATVPLEEGTHPVVATAEDAGHRTAQDQVVVTRDSTAPVVMLTAPSQVSRGRPGSAVAVTTEADVASLTVTWGAVQATCPSSPCTLPLTVPEGVASGTTIAVEATATDLAGNVGVAQPRGVTIVADGVVTGQVLSDATSLVLPGASVRMITGAGETSTTSDDEGRYSLPTAAASATIVVSAPEHTSVERGLAVESGTGTVPVDARLTPLAAPQVVGPDGGIVESAATAPGLRTPAVRVTVPANGVPPDTAFLLTPLSAQGLPGLLPLGWAPVAAFDLGASAALIGGAELRITFAEGAAPTEATHLARYDAAVHQWELAARDLAAADGAVTAALSQTGAYALVVPDDPTVAVPDVGGTLAGVDVVLVPVEATSSGSVNPSAVAPTGGTARGLLEIQSPVPMPSGTVVQAEVHETYTLRETDSSGANKVASTEKRLQDIVLFRPKGGAAGAIPPLAAATTLSADVPVTPSRTYGRAEIVKGEVVLDFLAGREGVRGSVGGNDAVDLQAADVVLRVPAHALGEDTAISLEVESSFSAFLPAGSGLTALSEVVVDLSGKALEAPASLSIGAGSVNPDDTLLVARVERDLTETIPRLAVVALAQLDGDRVVTRAYPGLPGIVEGGRYVFFRSAPVGFAAGTALAGGNPVRALIEPAPPATWPFIALSLPGGGFIIALPPGTTGLQASVPGTALAGSATVSVDAGVTTNLILALQGVATTLSITPQDGTVGVPVNVPFEIQATAPLQADTVTTQNVRLFAGNPADGHALAVRLVLGQNKTTVTVIPEPPPAAPDGPPATALAFLTSYTLSATGLKDGFGTDLPPASSTFTTRDDTPETRDLAKLVFSVPDAAGIVHITAPAGTLAPGSTILIINSGNGYVLTLTAGNDGEVSGELEATVADRLLITITDPAGHATNFERSQFYDAETGATVVGTGGGVITGPAGEELRIPDGALDKPVKLKVTSVSQADLQAAFAGDSRQPDLPGATFGSALKLEASEPVVFKKEAHLAFPLPDFAAVPEGQRPPKPEDAFYQVYRRISGPCRDGAAQCAPADHVVYFETLDNAFVEGEGANRKLVTPSYPFTGYANGWSRWDPIAGAGFDALGGGAGGAAIGVVATCWAMTMWTYTALLPGAPVSGVITGRVLQPVFVNGQTDPDYQGVAGVRVTRDDTDENATIAFSQEDGRFTFYDPHFIGGTVVLRAEVGGQTYTATAYAVERSDTKILSDPGLATLIRAGNFKNIATANITLPPQPAPQPRPQFGVHVMKETAGTRAEVSTVIVGTPLVIGFTTAAEDGTVATVTSTNVNGQAKNVVKETAPPAVLPMDFLLQDPASPDGKFTPTQAGSYTVSATALPPFGPALTAQVVFRVLAAGGSTTTALPGPPGVISVVPRNGTGGVPVTVFPEITFSEPVRNVPGNVRLLDSSGAPADITLAGVGVSDAGDVIPLESVTATSKVTSLTVQPLDGLKFGETYRIVVDGDIKDLDTTDGQETPNLVVPFESTFQTFLPAPVGGSADQPAMAGLAVLGNRAYAAETQYAGGTGGLQNGLLHVYDISDPTVPVDIPPGALISYPPRDLAALERTTQDADGNPASEKLVAVAANSRTYYQLEGEIVYYQELVSTPGNVFIYNVDQDTPRWVGAVSLTQNIIDGYASRIVMDGNTLFAATSRKGIQVVSLSQAMDGFEDEMADGAQAFQARQQLFSGGYRSYAVVQTIPMTSDTPISPLLLNVNDLKVGHVLVDGQPGRLVFGTGSSPVVAFVIVNPDSTEKIYQGHLESPEGSLDWGTALAVAKINNRDLVLVGGLAHIGGASTNGVAVVDVSDPRAFRILGWVPLTHSVGDIVISQDTAIVAGDRGSRAPDGSAGVATLVNLTDPTQPFAAGTLSGVGSRLALGPNDILFSTQREFLKGNAGELSGIRTATLNSLALVTGSKPDPILVDQAGIFLDRPTLSYKAVPPLTTNDATIKIDKNDAEFRNLLASFTNGKGTTDWFEDQPIDPRGSYEAKVDVRDGSGQTLPTIPKKLVVTRMPLSAETRDRQIEVRFAVPDPSDHQYSLRIYLASATGTFPSNPSLSLPWSTIQAAYDSIDDVFDDITHDSPKARDPYVIRKITKVSVPGVPELGAQKAFALEAIFGGYPRYRVSLVEEGPDNRELSRVEGQASFEPTWGAIVDDLVYAGDSTVITRSTPNDRLRLASNGMPLFQITLPDWSLWSGLAARASLPIKQMLGLLKDAAGKLLARSMSYQLAKGVVGGFVDGVVGDYNLIRHPIDSYHAIKDGLSALVNINFKDVDVLKMIKDTFNSMANEYERMTPFERFDSQLLLQAEVAYYVGYVAGMVLWQVVSALIIAAVTEGIGAVAEKTGVAAKVGAMAASLTAKIVRALKVLGRVAEFIVESKLVASMTDIWKAVLEMADGPLMVVSQKYLRGLKTMEPALKVMASSVSFGKTVIKYFARIAALPDEAAQRILAYMTRDEGVAAKVGAWLDAYTARRQIVNGIESNRALREALAAAPDFPNGLSDEVAERIVSACDKLNRADAVDADNLVATFVQKHRNPGLPAPPPLLSTEKLIQDLRQTPEGVAKAETIESVIRVHSVTGAQAWSEEALTGAARLVEQNGADGAAYLERFVREVTPDSVERIDRVLAKVKQFTDPEAVKGFGRLLRDGEASRMAKIIDNPTYQGIEEKLVQAIDKLRVNGPNSSLIPGITTVPAGPSSSPLLNTMINAANLGTAYEPVAILRLIDRNEFALGDIVELGRRFPLSGNRLAEADAFVVRGQNILVEIKHGPGSIIDLDQLARQEEAIANGLVDRVVYGLRDGYGDSAASQEIDAINARLRAAQPDRFPPGTDAIRVVPSLGEI